MCLENEKSAPRDVEDDEEHCKRGKRDKGEWERGEGEREENRDGDNESGRKRRETFVMKQIVNDIPCTTATKG